MNFLLYLRLSLRSERLISLRFARSAFTDGESKVHRSNGMKAIKARKPPRLCRNKPLLIPPSMAQL